MPFFKGEGANGLAVIIDSRTRTCQDLDGVLDLWGQGRRSLGKKEWGRTLRIALREAGSPVLNMAAVREQKAEVDVILKAHEINTVILVQTPATPNVRQAHSAWNMYGRGGSPYKWAGTVWLEDGLYRAPILNPVNYEFVYDWLLSKWIRQAHAVACRKLAPMPWPAATIYPGDDTLGKLKRIRAAEGSPVAVDIESNIAGTLITAIGFSNEAGTVSVPWDSYPIAGSFGEIEPALCEYPEGSAIERECVELLESQQPTIFHNGAYDTFMLNKRNIKVGNFAHDTLLMHRVVYPQYRHGLQMACATEFCVEPWKCFFKPPKVGTDEDKWLGDPIQLRLYNTKDAYATYQLYNHLKGKLG